MENENLQIVPRPKLSYLIIFSVIVTSLSLVSTGFFAYKYNQLKSLDTNISKTILPTPIIEEYKTAKDGSYEYPTGWHVAELWSPENKDRSREITLVMDPDPISTAPRDGPAGIFTITLISGKPNPDEILQQEMTKFNEETLKDITKETINADIGQVYHYTGKIKGQLAENEPVEQYFFTFNKYPPDPRNQQVVVASLLFNKDEKISQMFRHVVMSFK